MAQETRVVEFDVSQKNRLLEILDQSELNSRIVPHAIFSFAGPGITVTLYKSGKLLFQGTEVELWASRLIGESAAPNTHSPDSEDRIGADEAGKGDYLGPLVVAAAYVSPSEIARARKLGVTDSKSLADESIKRIAGAMHKFVPHEVIVMNPVEYNQVYSQIGNLNHLLSDLHVEAISRLASRIHKWDVLLDKFADPTRLKIAFKKRGLSINLVARTKAESQISVAAASIFARDGFLRGLSDLSDEAGVDLPKGASTIVEKAAKMVVRVHGPSGLGKFAKLHFKTTERVLGQLPY